MIKQMLRRAALVMGVALTPLAMAHAGVVDYTVTSLGGNSWRYDYTINNTTPSIGFDELTVYFDVTKFELLSSPTAPAGWDPIAIQPDTGIPSDGFFDVLDLGGLLGPGETVPGFSVTFAFLGAGSPGAQAFDLLDSSNFALVESGSTTAPRDPGQVPEPGSLALVALGVFAIRRSSGGQGKSQVTLGEGPVTV